MAYSQGQWKKAKGYFEAGKSLSYISQETGISKASISAKSKKDNWEKGKTEQQTEHLKAEIIDIDSKTEQIKKKTEQITEQVSTLEDYQIDVLKDLVEDATKQKSILMTGLNMAAIRATQKLQSNKKIENIKIREGFGTGLSKEYIEPTQSELSSSDIQDYTNVLVKAGQGLGLIEKDGTNVTVNNANNQQNNINKEIVTETLENFENEY